MSNCSLNLPVNFNTAFTNGFGSFRLPNVQQFNQYVNSKFYDKVFYAPKDNIVVSSVEGANANWNCFDDPQEYCDRPAVAGYGEIPAWSSYCLSPAGMFNPNIFARPTTPGASGYVNPWSRGGGFRSPAASQCRFPDLKTRMLEHHWLQARRAECNGNFAGGSSYACTPYFFNHSWESSPMTLFYDGHVGSVGCRKAERADARIREQSNGAYGLWSRDTPWGNDGYFLGDGYAGGQSDTSFHILTTEGILGRDILGN